MAVLRAFRYLRVSVTARCDHFCFYCRRPDEPPPARELSPAEIETIVRAAARRGVRAVRLTGGEPLLRADVGEIVARISRVEEIDDLSLTTNGVALAPKATELKRAGLARVNVHLPSLRKETYREITGRDDLDRVLAGIEAARAAGLSPIKTNTVLLRGVNDEEWAEIIEWANGVDVAPRFIEMMPQAKTRTEFEPVTCDELLKRIASRWGEARPLSTNESRGSGPARYYRIAATDGVVGLICSCTRPDCARCTRLRLSSDGRLRACLMSEETFALDGLLGAPPDSPEWDRLFARVREAKPEWGGSSIRAPMVTIGG